MTLHVLLAILSFGDDYSFRQRHDFQSGNYILRADLEPDAIRIVRSDQFQLRLTFHARNEQWHLHNLFFDSRIKYSGVLAVYSESKKHLGNLLIQSKDLESPNVDHWIKPFGEIGTIFTISADESHRPDQRLTTDHPLKKPGRYYIQFIMTPRLLYYPGRDGRRWNDDALDDPRIDRVDANAGRSNLCLIEIVADQSAERPSRKRLSKPTSSTGLLVPETLQLEPAIEDHDYRVLLERTTRNILLHKKPASQIDPDYEQQLKAMPHLRYRYENRSRTTHSVLNPWFSETFKTCPAVLAVFDEKGTFLGTHISGFNELKSLNPAGHQAWVNVPPNGIVGQSFRLRGTIGRLFSREKALQVTPGKTYQYQLVFYDFFRSKCPWVNDETLYRPKIDRSLPVDDLRREIDIILTARRNAIQNMQNRFPGKILFRSTPVAIMFN